MESLFVGRWRIVETEQWDRDFLDLVAPARITFARGGRGEVHFGVVDLTLDWRAPAAGGRVVFTFEGFDEGDEVSGRGWAKLDGDRLTGKILFHMGEKSGFVARKRPGAH